MFAEVGQKEKNLSILGCLEESRRHIALSTCGSPLPKGGSSVKWFVAQHVLIIIITAIIKIKIESIDCLLCAKHCS